MMPKEPRQARSKLTFRSILEAASQLLNRDDGSKLTTRGIAERAGVSIGSLYQYFRGEDSILATVLRERIARDVAEIWAEFEAGAGLAVEDRLFHVFRKTLETHLPTGRLRTTLFQRAPSLRLVEASRAEVEQLTARMFDSLEREGKIRPGLDRELAVYLLAWAVFGVTMSATMDHARMASRGDALARELAKLIAGYVSEPARV
jgi:AcrR family transcriptional regulator